MVVRLKYEDGRQLGRKFEARVKKHTEKTIRATQAVAFRAADEIEQEGRADIAAGGNFSSSRWQDGFQAKVSYQSRTDINVRVTHSVFYWKVFEHGAVIRGKPLLWIPLSFARDAQGVSAKDYPGQLFRIDRLGKAPLLMAGGGKGSKAEPKYFGKESVTIPKKFHLRDVVKSVSRRLGRYYKEAMSNGR